MNRALLSATTLVLIVVSTTAQAGLIDSFSVGDQNGSSGGGIVFLPSVAGPEIGGLRGASIFGNASVVSAGPSYSSELKWDLVALPPGGASGGFNVNLNSFGTVDITDGGTSSAILLSGVDFSGLGGPLNLSVQLSDASFNSDFTSIVIPSGTVGASLFVPLSSFVGVDPTQVTSVGLSATYSVSTIGTSQFFLDSISTTAAAAVPEPSSVALILTGLLALMGPMRYRKAAA